MKNVFFVSGQEDEDAEAKIKSLNSDNIKIEYRFGFDNEDIERTISDIQTPSLFGGEFFIVMENSDDISEKNAKNLAKVLTENDFSGVLVFRSKTKDISKSLDKIIPSSNKFTFYLMFEEKKAGYVRECFKKHGLLIENDTIREFLSLVENDKKSIKTAVNKLSGICLTRSGNKKIVEIEDVVEHLEYDRDSEIFKLFSCIATKDLRTAVFSFQSILVEKNGFIGFFSSLISYLRRAIGYMENIKNKVADVWNVYLASGFVAIRYPSEKFFIKSFSQNYSLNKARKMLYFLLKQEEQVRMGIDSRMQSYEFIRFLVSSLC